MVSLEDALAAAPRIVPKTLPEFVDRWSLDLKSQQFLHGLPEDVQREVIAGFDPAPGTRNVDAKLHAFARRVAWDLGHPELASRTGGGFAPHAVQPQGGSAEARGGAMGDDPVRVFAVKWGLDEGSEAMLRSQSPAVVGEVLANFAPDPNTRNVNGKLYAFVKTKTGGRTSTGGAPPPSSRSVSEDALGQFAETWKLDETATQMLRNLPSEVCFAVLADFNPPSDTQNVNARLNAFVRARLEKLGSGAAETMPPWRTSTFDPNRTSTFDPVRRFIEGWGCDSQCEAALRQLHPDHQSMVMRDFDPPPGTYNVSGKLGSFIRSVASRSPAAAVLRDPAAQFAAHWRLDGEAWQLLQSLSEEMRSAVMAEFDPPLGTLNVSGKLSAFIRSKLAAAGGQRAPWGPSQPTSAAEGAFAEFQAHWHLDDDAINLLRSLPEDVMHGVILDFQPRSGTWNPSGKLHAFVRARMKELGLDGAGWPGDGLSSAVGAGAGPALGLGDDISEFVAHWGLDRSSDDLLRGLPGDILARVLSSFEPQPNTRNRNAKLMTWVRSLQAQNDEGDAKRRRLQ